MEKVLKKYKTIPEHLYVNRNADKQLKSIIEEMESPGYVLVARQMGKTNLLFNAERDLKNDSRLFVYVDLSNLFESEKDCYQNIIDNIIEQNEEVLEKIESRIREIRKDELPPHKEYTRSLRAILKYFTGDIIVILDEIDALRSVEYSDHIFAQIRSTYFQRRPFPEYKRITYILSGVIDPTDLIKDKNKSPFNIGEKIYLDDFILEEHREFIRKSKLKVSNGISDEIFAWTNGNPRLTFDVCAEIESYILDGKEIDKEVISEIIHRKYLTNFDLPPIDHIRERIRANKGIQKAVASLHKGINDISDEARKTLYLYGIIDSSSSEKIVIKNKIIKKALSLEWIEKLFNEAEEKYTMAMSQYAKSNYLGAIATFKQILELSSDNGVSDEIIEASHYFIGRAYHYLREFNDAIKYLKFEYKNEKRKRNALSVLGSSLLPTEFNQALDILTEIINEGIDDWAHHNALLSLGINLLKKDEDRALKLFRDLSKSTLNAEKNYDNIDDLLQIKTLSLYYQFVIQDKKGLKEDAVNCLKIAMQYATSSDSLSCMFNIYLLEKDEKVMNELILKIINKKIVFSKEKVYPITFVELDLLQYIDLVFENKDLFEKIIQYALDDIYKGEKTRYQLLYMISQASSERNEEYLKIILSNKEIVEMSLYINVIRDLSMVNKDDKYHFFKYFDEYFELFKTNSVVASEADIYSFALAIRKKMDLQHFPKALEYCNILEESIKITQNEELNFEALIIYYFQAEIYSTMKNKEAANVYSEKALSLIKESSRLQTSMIDEEGLQFITTKMNAINDSYKKTKQIIRGKKYQRNEIIKVQYTNGKILEGKYKKLEKDIVSKLCKII